MDIKQAIANALENPPEGLRGLVFMYRQAKANLEQSNNDVEDRRRGLERATQANLFLRGHASALEDALRSVLAEKIENELNKEI